MYRKQKKTIHETQKTRYCWRPAGVWGDLLKITIDVEELHISMLTLGDDDYEDEDDNGDNDEGGNDDDCDYEDDDGDNDEDGNDVDGGGWGRGSSDVKKSIFNSFREYDNIKTNMTDEELVLIPTKDLNKVVKESG